MYNMHAIFIQLTAVIHIKTVHQPVLCTLAM